MLDSQKEYMVKVNILQEKIKDLPSRFKFHVRPLFYLFESAVEQQPIMVSPDIMVYVEVSENEIKMEGFHCCPANVRDRCERYPFHF